jgi:hypothetical protein
MIFYAMGGAAIGTFETNFLCCLTPLGPKTKHVSITAIPVGITLVLVGGFFAMGPPFHIPAHCVYIAVAAQIVACMVLFSWRIPQVSHREPRDGGVVSEDEVDAGDSRASLQRKPSLSPLATGATQWKLWLPVMWHFPLASIIDMFILSAFSPGVALYLWDRRTVTVEPGFVLPTDTFFALFNMFAMMGGVCGRILSYRVKVVHPLLFSLLSMAGALMILTKVSILAPVGIFTAQLGDGLIYGSIALRIDTTVPQQFNLIAISFWLFVGDIGSVVGSNLICYIKLWVK